MSTVATPAKRGKKKTPLAEQAQKQLAEMKKLGMAIKSKDAIRAEQETVVASAKSELDEQREELHKYERELEELHSELALLSIGGFPERLPFGKGGADATAPATTPAAAPAPADNVWRSVPLTEAFAKVKANAALLALLADGKIKRGPGQGNVAGIRTLGELADFTNGDRKLTDIGGLGEAKATLVADAVTDYWIAIDKEKKAAAQAPATDALTIFTPADVSLAPGKVEAACHPHLLTSIGNDRTANVRELIDYDGRQYVVTPAPAGNDADVYAMREVTKLPDGERPTIERSDADAYMGGQILFGGDTYLIAGFAKAILVRDGGAAKSEPESAEPTADAAEPAKKSGKRAAKGKGKKRAA